MSDKKIKTCAKCFHKKRNFWEYEGQEICEDCLGLKIFDKTLRDELLTDSNVRIVAMETGIFTERTPNLRVYLATMQATNFLLDKELSGTNKVNLEDLVNIVQGYSADLEADVIPVLQKVGLLGTFIDGEETILGKRKMVKYISTGKIFEEVSKRWQGKQKDQALYLLSRLVSSGTLSETQFKSGVRDIFVNAIVDELIDDDGSIDDLRGYYEIESYKCTECGKIYNNTQKDQLEQHLIDKHAVPVADIKKYYETNQNLIGYLVSQKQLEDFSKRYMMPFKSFIDKLYVFVKYRLLFNEKEPSIIREGETYWIVKPEWVKTLSKTKINTKEYIKNLEKEKEKIK